MKNKEVVVVQVDKIKKIKRLSRSFFKDVNITEKVHMSKNKYSRKVKHRNNEAV